MFFHISFLNSLLNILPLSHIHCILTFLQCECSKPNKKPLSPSGRQIADLMLMRAYPNIFEICSNFESALIIAATPRV